MYVATCSISHIKMIHRIVVRRFRAYTSGWYLDYITMPQIKLVNNYILKLIFKKPYIG